MNRDKIRNPHLIYPDDVVILDLNGANPKLRLLHETVKLEPTARVEALVSEMRKDLYEISCKNTAHNAEGQKLVSEAYGW